MLLTLSLANLLENANTHTPHLAEITVSVAKAGSGVELCVADNGPGVPVGDSMRIFQRFYRLEESRTTSGQRAGIEHRCGGGRTSQCHIFATDNLRDCVSG